MAQWRDARSSSITQPPIVAEVLRAVGDRALWEERFEPACRYYDWWLRRRDPDGDGLCSVWHVWELGADATPRADAACRALVTTGRAPRSLANQTINPTAKKRPDLLVARFLMLEDLQAIDEEERSGALPEGEAQRRRARLFGLEAVDMQAYLVRNLTDLAAIGEALGEASRVALPRGGGQDRAGGERRALGRSGGFLFRSVGEREEPVRVWTPAPFVALYAGDLVPRERAERLLEHLLDPEKFWTRWPVSTVARDAPEFDADEYWRGSTWVNVNWFVVRGLVASAARFDDARYLPPARAIAERTLAVVEAAGFREYYRAGGRVVGEDAAVAAVGFGPEAFGWSGLALEMARFLEEELAGVAPAP